MLYLPKLEKHILELKSIFSTDIKKLNLEM